MPLDISPGFVAAKHALAIDLEEMRRARLESELEEHFRILRSREAIKTWLNMQLRYANIGLKVINCNSR
jgi:hypothetical protein